MINYIKYWLKQVLHIHEWEVIETHTVRQFQDDSSKRAISTRKIFIQKCKICGKIHKELIKL